LVFDPGGNTASIIDWVGRAIEAVTGQQLAVYFHQNILGPLGMTIPTTRYRRRSRNG
jgi:CubicO group peptidase (beta-lactamase class C family)